MDTIKNFLGDAHTLLAVLILIATSVFVALGRMTVDEWKNMVEYVFTIWGGTHVGVTVADAFAKPAPVAIVAAVPPKVTP